jgi:hypothetical protein
VAKNPDPSLKLTSLKGVTRTLDDWSTMFHLTLVILPGRPEASAWVPVARRIFRTFRDADCRTAYCVTGPAEVARRVLADAADEALVFVDPDGALVQSLGLERLPAFVHLRQDTTLVAAAEGWDPREWQRVAREVGKAMAWTVPEVIGPGDPAPTSGWSA